MKVMQLNLLNPPTLPILNTQQQQTTVLISIQPCYQQAITILSKLWPIFVAFILLIVTLAQAHYRIKVLEEKVKVAFELINKLTDKK